MPDGIFKRVARRFVDARMNAVRRELSFHLSSMDDDRLRDLGWDPESVRSGATRKMPSAF